MMLDLAIDIVAKRLARDETRMEIEQRTGMRDAERDGCRIVFRDPCARCAVRADIHDEMGCRRWVEAP